MKKILQRRLFPGLDSKVQNSYDITYITDELRPISGGINTAVGQNEGSLVRKLCLAERCDMPFEIVYEFFFTESVWSW